MEAGCLCFPAHVAGIVRCYLIFLMSSARFSPSAIDFSNPFSTRERNCSFPFSSWFLNASVRYFQVSFADCHLSRTVISLSDRSFPGFLCETLDFRFVVRQARPLGVIPGGGLVVGHLNYSSLAIFWPENQGCMSPKWRCSSAFHRPEEANGISDRLITCKYMLAQEESNDFEAWTSTCPLYSISLILCQLLLRNWPAMEFFEFGFERFSSR